jgi:DNA-binding transcriptional MerR regulator
MIQFCQQLGFTLAEIRQLVTPPNGRNGKQEWRDLVDRKLLEVDGAIARA